MLVVVVSVWLVGLTSAERFDPYVLGPHQTGHTEVTALFHPGLPENLGIWAPKDNGSYPVVVFLTGLQEEIPGVVYDNVLTHVASHGVLTVAVWSLTAGTDPEKRAFKLDTVHAWISRHLQHYLDTNGFTGVTADLNRVVMLSHSSAGHVAVSYLERQCGTGDLRYQSAILFSPVDGLDPFGIVDEFCITPGQKLNYTLPTFVMTAGLDATPGSVLGPPCAPSALSNDRFYNASNAPRWQVNATRYGHADCLNDVYWEAVAVSHFCSVCDAGECDRPVYRRYVAGQIISFTLATTDPEQHCEQLAYLEDGSLNPVTTEARFERPDDVCGLFLRGCSRP